VDRPASGDDMDRVLRELSEQQQGAGPSGGILDDDELPEDLSLIVSWEVPR